MAKKKKTVYGEGSWTTVTINNTEYVRFRKKYDSKTKTFYGKTNKEVKKKVDEYERKNGYLVSDDVEKIILFDYINNWIENVKKKSVKERTYDTYKDTVKYYIEPFEIATMQMGNLSSDIIQQHYNNMAEKYSMSAIKKVQSLLTMVFKYAMIKHDIFENPLFAVELPSKSNVKEVKKIEVLTDDDMDKLFNEVNRVNLPHNRINGQDGTTIYSGTNKYIIILLLYTGMRIGEALAIKWSDYNEKNKTLRIKDNMVLVKTGEGEKRVYKINTPKTESGIRIIALSKRAIWALNQLKALSIKSEYICVSVNGITPSQSAITRTLKSMLRNAQIDVNYNHFGLHDLRHTFASYQIRHGTDITVVSALIGHRSPETTMRIYSHVIEEQKINAIKIFDKEEDVDIKD